MSRDFGLGRIPAPDPRDARHPLTLVTPLRATVATRYWRCGPVLDQGSTPHCVAYAWSQFIRSAPFMSILPLEYEQNLYARAQILDEFPGEDYDGTSVRGGVKAVQEQGRVSEYLWSNDADEVRRYVLSRGPIVAGTDWFEEMFFPELNKGYLVPDGPLVGGHAWLIVGFSEKRRAFRMLNSWGTSWGTKG